MGEFHSTDGFVHFVFANRQDRYILSSLVRLELTGYLYCTLKRAGYRGVFFLDGLDGDYRLTMLDPASREIYAKRPRKFPWAGRSDAGERSQPAGQPAALVEQLTALLKKGQNLALVFQLDTFCEVMGQAGESRLEAFSRAGQRQLAQNGNILILAAPVNAGGSLPYLTDPAGVFGGGLCPELRMLLQEQGNGMFYRQLAKAMGPRCVFLNAFSREQMQRLARYVCLVERQGGSAGEIQDLGDFLYAWYRSPGLRAKTGPILPANETRQFAPLVKELTAVATWRGVQQWIEALRREKPQGSLLGVIADPLIEEQPPILADDLLAKKMRQIQLPLDLFRDSPDQAARFARVARDYCTPWRRPPEGPLAQEIMACMTLLEHAAERRDRETVRRAVECLALGTSRGFAYGEVERQMWQYRMTGLSISQELFRLDRLVAEDTRRLIQQQQEKKALIAQVRRQQEVSGSLAGKTAGFTGGDHSLSVKMHQVVNLDRQIEALGNARAQKQSILAERRNALQSLDLAADMVGLGASHQVEAVLQDAAQVMERNVVANLQLEDRLREVNQTMGYILQEAQMDEDAVAAAYQRIVADESLEIQG